MPRTITRFDTSAHHIYTTFFIIHPVTKARHRFDGIIDTGAPRTEFSDIVLARAGIIASTNKDVKIKAGLQTQKYGKIVFHEIEICGYVFPNFEGLISRLDESWGIDALIGLDFFRRFRVTIDYKIGYLITEPL